MRNPNQPKKIDYKAFKYTFFTLSAAAIALIIFHIGQNSQPQNITQDQTIQYKQHQIEVEKLEKEYSDILDLAKKLIVNVVFVNNTIEFHTDSEKKINQIKTIVIAYNTPYMLISTQNPNNPEEKTSFILRVTRGERGSLKTPESTEI